MEMSNAIGKKVCEILEIAERNHTQAEEGYQELRNKITDMAAWVIEAKKELDKQGCEEKKSFDFTTSELEKLDYRGKKDA